MRAHWLEQRQAELLPVEYFHVVFTVPQQIAAIAYQNKAVVYGMLFRATAETLRAVAANPKLLGAEIGFIAILHTWGQNLLHHPHLHCVVPGGGIAPDGQRWIACRPGFFLPVRVLSRLFRRRFMTQLREAFDRQELHFFNALAELQDARAFARYLAPVSRAEWVVYAKPPFGGPKRVLEYLGRYTHRVAIANSRLIARDRAGVSFRWKDYRAEGRDRQKVMTLSTAEFIRRFLIHVLPRGFHRIRHYGLLASSTHKDAMTLARELLGVAAPIEEPERDEPPDHRLPCPCCGGHMTIIETFARWCQPRAPPAPASSTRKHTP